MLARTKEPTTQSAVDIPDPRFIDNVAALEQMMEGYGAMMIT